MDKTIRMQNTWQRRNFINLMNARLVDSPIWILEQHSLFPLGSGAAESLPKLVIRVLDPEFYSHVLTYSHLGLAEAYLRKYFTIEFGSLEGLLDTWLTVPAGFPYKLYLSCLAQAMAHRLKCFVAVTLQREPCHSFNTRLRENVRQLSPDIFTPQNQTQINIGNVHGIDFEQVCAELNLENGNQICDVGCGDAGLLIYAASKFNISGVGITNHKSQWEKATRAIDNLGLVSRLKIHLRDYTSEDFFPNGTVDRIISRDALEQMPHHTYNGFFARIRKCLNHKGKGLIYVQTNNEPDRYFDPFIRKYICQNSSRPRLSEVIGSVEGNALFVFGSDNLQKDLENSICNQLADFRSKTDNLESRFTPDALRVWEYFLSCSKVSVSHALSSLYAVKFGLPKD